MGAYCGAMAWVRISTAARMGLTRIFFTLFLHRFCIIELS